MPYKDPHRRREWLKREREQTKSDLQKLKDQPCMDCGGSFPHWIMEFDHVPERGKKRYTIPSVANQKITSKPMVEELAKCDVVCANCHRDRTYRRNLESLVPLELRGDAGSRLIENTRQQGVPPG